MYKTIGILGGMGPAATCDLMKKIIQQTDAVDDQHHIHICVDCNTNIPDRTNAILHNGSNPVPELVKSGVKLQGMGADVLIMPCNTAHYFYDEIVPYLDIPLLNMPAETAEQLAGLGVKRAGVLATDGTLQSGIYKRALSRQGIEAVYPDEDDQKAVMALIYQYIKKGITDKKALSALKIGGIVKKLRRAGAQKIILACTELPIAFSILGIENDTVDPTLILARAAIRYAGARTVEMDAVS